MDTADTESLSPEEQELFDHLIQQHQIRVKEPSKKIMYFTGIFGTTDGTYSKKEALERAMKCLLDGKATEIYDSLPVEHRPQPKR